MGEQPRLVCECNQSFEAAEWSEGQTQRQRQKKISEIEEKKGQEQSWLKLLYYAYTYFTMV